MRHLVSTCLFASLRNDFRFYGFGKAVAGERSAFAPGGCVRSNGLDRGKQEKGCCRGSSGGGGRVALDFFFGEKTPEYFANESARQAILQLDAREAPAGEMEVVLGPGWPGVLLHEAIGHGLDAKQQRVHSFDSFLYALILGAGYSYSSSWR